MALTSSAKAWAALGQRVQAGEGHRRAHELIAHMDQRVRYAERWHGAIRDWPGELSLTWGMLDPVARVEVLRGLQELRRDVLVTELPGLGHYPQIEDPVRVAEVVSTSLPPQDRSGVPSSP